MTKTELQSALAKATQTDKRTAGAFQRAQLWPVPLAERRSSSSLMIAGEGGAGNAVPEAQLALAYGKRCCR